MSGYRNQKTHLTTINHLSERGRDDGSGCTVMSNDEFKHCILSYSKIYWSWEPVAHAFNPDYLGGGDWEDQSSRPAWVNSSQDFISKINKMDWRCGWSSRVSALQAQSPRVQTPVTPWPPKKLTEKWFLWVSRWPQCWIVKSTMSHDFLVSFIYIWLSSFKNNFIES
jgi:hypothetical protein